MSSMSNYLQQGNSSNIASASGLNHSGVSTPVTMGVNISTPNAPARPVGIPQTMLQRSRSMSMVPLQRGAEVEVAPASPSNYAFDLRRTYGNVATGGGTFLPPKKRSKVSSPSTSDNNDGGYIMGPGGFAGPSTGRIDSNQTQTIYHYDNGPAPSHITFGETPRIGMPTFQNGNQLAISPRSSEAADNLTSLSQEHPVMSAVNENGDINTVSLNQTTVNTMTARNLLTVFDQALKDVAGAAHNAASYAENYPDNINALIVSIRDSALHGTSLIEEHERTINQATVEPTSPQNHCSDCGTEISMQRQLCGPGNRSCANKEEETDDEEEENDDEVEDNTWPGPPYFNKNSPTSTVRTLWPTPEDVRQQVIANKDEIANIMAEEQALQPPKVNSMWQRVTRGEKNPVKWVIPKFEANGNLVALNPDGVQWEYMQKGHKVSIAHDPTDKDKRFVTFVSGSGITSNDTSTTDTFYWAALEDFYKFMEPFEEEVIIENPEEMHVEPNTTGGNMTEKQSRSRLASLDVLRRTQANAKDSNDTSINDKKRKADNDGAGSSSYSTSPRKKVIVKRNVGRPKGSKNKTYDYKEFWENHDMIEQQKAIALQIEMQLNPNMRRSTRSNQPSILTSDGTSNRHAVEGTIVKGVTVPLSPNRELTRSWSEANKVMC